MLRRSLIQSRKILDEIITSRNPRTIGSLPQADSVGPERVQFSFVEMTRDSTRKVSPTSHVYSPEDSSGRILLRRRSLNGIEGCEISVNSMDRTSPAPSTSALIQIWDKIESPGYLDFIVDKVRSGNNNDLCWRADSVRRKRKKKMNKHKHAKRRKLNRHRK